MSIFSAIGNAVSGLLGGGSGNSGAQAAAATANPFGGQYQQYQAPLANLLLHPGTFQETPTQQAVVAAGSGQIAAQQAALGLSGSTAQGAALANYATTQAGNFYQQDVNNLEAASGLTTAQSSGATAAGSILQGQNLQNQASLGSALGFLFNGSSSTSGSPFMSGMNSLTKMLGGGSPTTATDATTGVNGGYTPATSYPVPDPGTATSGAQSAMPGFISTGGSQNLSSLASDPAAAAAASASADPAAAAAAYASSPTAGIASGAFDSAGGWGSLSPSVLASNGISSTAGGLAGMADLSGLATTASTGGGLAAAAADAGGFAGAAGGIDAAAAAAATDVTATATGGGLLDGIATILGFL